MVHHNLLEVIQLRLSYHLLLTGSSCLQQCVVKLDVSKQTKNNSDVFPTHTHTHTHTQTMEYYSALKKEGNPVICDSMDETGEHFLTIVQ